MSDLGAIRSRYRRFADVECQGYSDLYFRLAHIAAQDDQIVEFIAAMPDTQPNLFFAAIQFLTGSKGMPETAPELRRFLKRRGVELRDAMRSRRTQTNEVGRCAVLVPALPAGPLALIEVGASAGLCLLLDQFHYTWGSMAIGPVSSPVHLPCAVSGPVPLPSITPEIAWRQGLDLHPLDVDDDDAVRWLRACVWPDQPERRRRLDGAIELARSHPPAVRIGDLVDDLPDLLAGAPHDALVVVFHSAVLSYVSPDRRRAFVATLADESKRRDIVWVSNEAPGVIDEVSDQAPRLDRHHFLIGRKRFTAGHGQAVLLGFAHPHGAQLRWHEPDALPAGAEPSPTPVV